MSIPSRKMNLRRRHCRPALILMLTMTLPALASPDQRGSWLPLACLSLIFTLVLAILLARLRSTSSARFREQEAQMALLRRENQSLHDKLQQLSTTDSLTGLLNQRHLNTVMLDEVARIARDYNDWLEGRAFAPTNSDMLFMVIDIDRFSLINERYSREIGDAVLVRIGPLIRQVVRDTDLLFRLEDDQFLALFRMANRDSGPFLAERMRRLIEGHLFEIDGVTIQLTATLGFSCFPFVRRKPHVVTWEECLSIAQWSVQRARRGGHNHWTGLYSTQRCDGHEVVARIIEQADVMITAGELKLLGSKQEEARIRN